MIDQPKSIAIVGAGLVGSLLACYLAKRGHNILVFERRSDMRKADIDGGRSINLAMSVRGWSALEKVGLKDKMHEIAIPMKGRMIHQTDGTTDFQPYGKEDEAIYSISRAALNMALMDEADSYDNVQFHFNEKCQKIDFKKANISFENKKRGTVSHFNADLTFGSDGAFSAVRYAMQKTPQFSFSQNYLSHGYKELCIPAGKDGKHQLDKNALHIWPRGNFMLIALPNLDGSFTVTLFAPYKGDNSFEKLTDEKSILDFFKNHFSTALQYMPELINDFNENPTGSLVTIKCDTWFYQNTCLIGDASHAIVPFYGQGMNAGFEDCRVLDEIIDRHQLDNWDKILEEYNELRVPDGNAIADLAVRHFMEMSDSTADDDFLLRKEFEQFLMKKFEDKFLSQYSMVTFSNTRYSTALKKGDKQTAYLEKLLTEYPDKSTWGNPELLKKVAAFLESNI